MNVQARQSVSADKSAPRRLIGFQIKRRQRWQGQIQRVWPSVRRLTFRLHPAHIAHPAPAVFCGIAI